MSYLQIEETIIGLFGTLGCVIESKHRGKNRKKIVLTNRTPNSVKVLNEFDQKKLTMSA